MRAARLLTPSNRAMPIAAEIAFTSRALAEGGEMTATFDWRQTGEQTWEIAADLADGTALRLTGGGTTLTADGATVEDAPRHEYDRIYARFADLVASADEPRRHGSLRAGGRRPSWWAGARTSSPSRTEAGDGPPRPAPGRTHPTGRSRLRARQPGARLHAAGPGRLGRRRRSRALERALRLLHERQHRPVRRLAGDRRLARHMGSGPHPADVSRRHRARRNRRPRRQEAGAARPW